MKPGGGREKGRKFEKQVARWLEREVRLGDVDDTPALLERGRKTEMNGIDLSCRTRTGLFVGVQCKVGAAPNAWAALKEAESVAQIGDAVAIAVVKRNRAKGRPKPETMVVMSPDAFARLMTR